MTATDARPATDAGDDPGSGPSATPLRPGRMETDRLATRVAEGLGMELPELGADFQAFMKNLIPVQQKDT